MKALKNIRNDSRVIRVVLALSALTMFVLASGAPHGHN